LRLRGAALEQIAAAYVLGSLSQRVCRRFESLLQQDVLARRACQHWEQQLAGLALDLPSVRPPEYAWQTLLDRVQQPAAGRGPRLHRWVWVAALLAAVVVAAYWLRLTR
jgi:anti-sigma-K factor RskA